MDTNIISTGIWFQFRFVKQDAWCGTGERPFEHSIILNTETLNESEFITGEFEHCPSFDLSEQGISFFFSTRKKAEITVIFLSVRKPHPYGTKLFSLAETTQLVANFFEKFAEEGRGPAFMGRCAQDWLDGLVFFNRISCSSGEMVSWKTVFTLLELWAMRTAIVSFLLRYSFES